jgi:hypothetical protein
VNNYTKILFVFSTIFFFNTSHSTKFVDLSRVQTTQNRRETTIKLNSLHQRPSGPKSIHDPYVKQCISSSHRNYIHVENVPPKPNKNWTQENFKSHFVDHFKSNPQMVTVTRHSNGTVACTFTSQGQQTIFRHYNLYVYPGFRDFVRTLPEFKKFIVDFKNQGFPSMCKLNADVNIFPEIRALCRETERTFCSHMCEWFPHPCYMSDPDIIAGNTVDQAPQLKTEVQNTLQDANAPESLKEACKERLEALNNTIANNGALSIITMEISPTVVKVAERYGIDLPQLQLSCGSDIMHTMQKEILNIMDQKGRLPEGVLISNIEQCAVVGLDYTKRGNIGNAMAFADVCHVTIDHIKRFGTILAEYTQGVGLGACDAAINTAHMLRHPVKTAQEVITGMSTIASYVSQAMLRMGYINELTAIDPEAGYQEQLKFTHEVNQITDAVTKTFNEKYAAMSTRDIVRQGTSFFVEGWLAGKAITALSSLSSKAVMLSRIAAGSIKNAIRGSEALEPVAGRIVTPEGIHFNVAKGTSSVAKIKTNQIHNQISQSVGKERVIVEIKNPVLENIRSGSALKKDAYHAFDNIIDNYASHAKKFDLVGGDGITRQLYQIEGSLNGANGVFEWIVDPRPNCGVTHRLFIKNGMVTGIPNNR